MDMSNKDYERFVEKRAAASPLLKDSALAFLIGGAICVIGQAIMDGFTALGLEKTDAGTATSISLIALSALLTGLNLYNKLGRWGGAGTLVPITGFANAVVSPAIDAKSEGLILGVGAKIFTVAGPVLLYGTLAGTLYGVVYWVATTLQSLW